MSTLNLYIKEPIVLSSARNATKKEFVFPSKSSLSKNSIGNKSTKNLARFNDSSVPISLTETSKYPAVFQAPQKVPSTIFTPYPFVF